ncbi:hypothetical protein H5P28_10910 [Ruficoccus amylovorans]|uniref:Methyltransferase FkbM domain-containing protein n=1 Tax=Ruficoccus amylovorans TaxID=1804625 RepID=A0A842HHR3_9BACT|nr:hypothetical protein [Ruficoccus amylovorans]MBC2594771.1 hypothetical protein [Ruficoccus amylovorans]
MPNPIKIWIKAAYARYYRSDFCISLRASLAKLDRDARDLHWAKMLDRQKAVLAQVCPDMRVLGGPFAGLRYDGWKVAGSALPPKLLGTYEKELYPAIEEIIRSQPSLIIDIGAAEGYYAVGLARALPQSRVVAFELRESARELLRDFAALHGVGERLSIHAGADQQTLLAAAEAQTGFILCDCEGAEFGLLTRPGLEALRSFSLLIEVHDFVDPAGADRLERELSQTHQVERIPFQPRRPEDFPVPSDLSNKAKMACLDEGRQKDCYWLYARPK